jgi:hypothetical protein
MNTQEQEQKQQEKKALFDWKSSIIAANSIIVFLTGLASFLHYQIMSPDFAIQFRGGFAEGILLVLIGATGIFISLFVRD